jgi:GDPmannose 4,6-dehydratase
MSKTAFITGVMGQDGTYLKNILLSNNYKVIGFDKFVYKNNDIEYHYDDISEYKVVINFFKKYNPDVVFNLAGVSDVFNPWGNTSEIIKSNIIIPENFIKAIIYTNPNIVFCQASSCLVRLYCNK